MIMMQEVRNIFPGAFANKNAIATIKGSSLIKTAMWMRYVFFFYAIVFIPKNLFQLLAVTWIGLEFIQF